ncbi:MAG: hypothetical protein KatS3mg004_0487 [Bryobacteraceae bacterium]|nr:MAG: hypothetical protein KatS3mg004_0487 [Bryobacteraceae bacterium]
MEEALELLLKALRRGTRGGIAEPEHELQYPLYPVPRVAVLGLALRGPRGVHCLPQWSPQELEKLRPQALAGWWRDLAEAGRLAAAGRLELPGLRYPILVFLPPESAPLPQPHHQKLWSWFRVPVSEQIRMPDGRLLAYECDARCGYHLSGPDAAQWLVGMQPCGTCPCGSPAPLYRVERVRVAGAAG